MTATGKQHRNGERYQEREERELCRCVEGQKPKEGEKKEEEKGRLLFCLAKREEATSQH